MKLAVYGDSFGVKNNDDHEFWVSNVVDKLGTSCENYCENSCSLFYSYKQFLNTQDNYDRIIFLATLPSRYTKPIFIKIGRAHV